MNDLKKLFTFSATERYGILTLCFGVIALIIFNSFQSSSREVKINQDLLAQFDVDANNYYKSDDKISVQYSDKKEKYKTYSKYKNPKLISPEKYSQEEQQIAVVDDFLIEINSASAEDFQKVRGIGEVLSERIIKFRLKLKGFHSVHQLSDVYGVEKEVIESNSKHFTVNKSKMNSWSINQTEFKELLKHPYLNYDAVKCIFGFRNKSDSVLVSEAISCVPDSLQQNLKPYLIH